MNRKTRKEIRITSVPSTVLLVVSLALPVSTPIRLFLFAVFITSVSMDIYRSLSKQKLNASMRDIDKMDGVEFEDYLIALFRKQGYKVSGTPVTNDYGADLIMESKVKVVVQAKRYKNAVGIKAVQEVVSAKTFYHADEAWVVTNNYFTFQARNLANSADVKLIDRRDLHKLILKVNPKVVTSEDNLKRTESPKCLKCGSEMTLREGKHGVFWGCASYPNCRHTEKVDSL